MKKWTVLIEAQECVNVIADSEEDALRGAEQVMRELDGSVDWRAVHAERNYAEKVKEAK